MFVFLRGGGGELQNTGPTSSRVYCIYFETTNMNPSIYFAVIL